MKSIQSYKIAAVLRALREGALRGGDLEMVHIHEFGSILSSPGPQATTTTTTSISITTHPRGLRALRGSPRRPFGDIL